MKDLSDEILIVDEDSIDKESKILVIITLKSMEIKFLVS